MLFSEMLEKVKAGEIDPGIPVVIDNTRTLGDPMHEEAMLEPLPDLSAMPELDQLRWLVSHMQHTYTSHAAVRGLRWACPQCGGTGAVYTAFIEATLKFDSERCTACDGVGRVRQAGPGVYVPTRLPSAPPMPSPEAHTQSVISAYLNGYGHGGGEDQDALASWLQTSTDRGRLIFMVGIDLVRAAEAALTPGRQPRRPHAKTPGHR